MLGFDKTCCGVRMAARKKCDHLPGMEIEKEFGLKILPPPGA